MLYKSLALPYFDYGYIVYTVTSKANLIRLQMVQNSACRAILCVNREFHNFDAHTELGILPLHLRSEMFILTECHKSVYTNDLYCLSEFFVPVLHITGHVTRHAVAKNMKVPFKCANMGKKSFSFRGPYTWNQLSTAVKEIDDFVEFKHVIGTELSTRFRTSNNVFPT